MEVEACSDQGETGVNSRAVRNRRRRGFERVAETRCEQATHACLAHVLLEDDGAWLALLDKLVRVECLEEQEEA